MFAHARSGEYDKAIDCFNKAIKAEKCSAIFFSNRGGMVALLFFASAKIYFYSL